MADLRILIAAALNSSDLSQSDLVEAHIDRIGAMAFADALGGALWALKWGRRYSDYPRALALLTARSKRVCGDLQMRRRLCWVVLMEWYDDLCDTCGGRRMMVATEMMPTKPCAVCNGTGRRRASDVWRMRQLGMEPSVYRKWEPRIGAVQQKVTIAEELAWRQIAEQLGRREPRKTLDPTGRIDILNPRHSAREGA